MLPERLLLLLGLLGLVAPPAPRSPIRCFSTGPRAARERGNGVQREWKRNVCNESGKGVQ
eukprot:3932134-Rhodomonas_salina.2